jgi:hypothetical protein
MTRKTILFSLIVIATYITGCGVETISNAAPPLYQDGVDLRFREFYDWLGGENVLGPVISAKFNSQGYEYQYTVTALLVFIPGAQDSQRYRLAPIGHELGIAEPPMDPDAPGGHEIYPGFMSLYNQLGGLRYIGYPITDARYNADKRRIEQYFESVGFYHLESNSEDVKLLHYGAWKCGRHCGYDPSDDAEVVLWSSIGSGFDSAIQRLDPSFTGYPLTPAHTASDGVLEQIFENVVVTADKDNPGIISLRPILGMIGIPIQEPGDYYVPDFFMEYISRNSGLEFSGLPLTEYAALSSEVFRQCFTNLCLDFFPNAPEGMQVRPAPLGYTYKSLYYQPADETIGSNLSSEITIRVWETYSYVADNESQEIGVRLESGQYLMENFEPILTLDIPDVGEIKYTFPPTNQDGISYLVLDPINAVNGTRIEYQVCVKNFNNDDYCVADDFLIWGE